METLRPWLPQRFNMLVLCFQNYSLWDTQNASRVPKRNLRFEFPIGIHRKAREKLRKKVNVATALFLVNKGNQRKSNQHTKVENTF